MRGGAVVWASALAVGIGTNAFAQDLVITSFQGNGQLAWTNAVETNALYRLEWAPSAAGPWHQTFQGLRTIDGHSDTSFTVAVPMFYRVVKTTNAPPPGMVWIDGGDAELGQAGIAEPVHTHFISGFWMDEMEVTRERWDEVYVWATNHAYVFENAGSGKTNGHPAHTVSWYDCVKWCNARSEREERTPCYCLDAVTTAVYRAGTADVANAWVRWDADGYRLPTEAEWEKAARGDRQGHLFPWGGETVSHSQANYLSNAGYAYDVSPTRGYHPLFHGGDPPFTSPPGSFPANGCGLHDMAGNVWEWCWDWYGDYSAEHQIDPHGPTSGQYGALRILRGGGWNSHAYRLRCANRYWLAPGFADNQIGFRCVRSR